MTTFTSLTPKARRQAKRNAGLANQSQVRGKNKLAELREKAAAPPEPEKAYAGCKCHKERVGRETLFIVSVHCSTHWTYGEQEGAGQRGQQTERGRIKRAGNRSY
jgi:hypothetical protein